MKGIRENIPLPPSIDVNIYKLTDEEREALGVKNLPNSLNEAIAIAKKSDFVTELLGKEMKKKYLAAKTEEYGEYRKTISEWELNTYMMRY